MSPQQVQDAQKTMCENHGVEFVPLADDSISGLARSTLGLNPVNGLRHPPQSDASGWYVWCGEEFSAAADFFTPVHTKHLYNEFPQIMPLLALPPGSRFLVTGNYVDIWFDQSLLSV
jgi:hypothetical protein